MFRIDRVFSIMKKSLLALAVAALAAASTVSATTVYDKDGTSLSVYGRIQAVWYSNDVSGVSNDQNSINASGRLGLDLRTQLTSGVAGFAKAEWEDANGNNKNDENDGFDARYLWVGVDFGQFGQIKAGKFEEAIKYAISPTDQFDDWGCTGLAGNDDRREGVIQYQWSGYGVDAIASYAFAKDNEHLDGAYFVGENVDLDASWSVALGYTSPDVVFGPIGVRVGYAGGNFADNVNNGSGTGTDRVPATNENNIVGNFYYDSYSQWALSAFWGKLNIGPYVAAVYQCRSFDLNPLAGYTGNRDYDVSGWEFIFGYSFANGVTIRTGYETQNIDIDNSPVDVDAATVPVYVNWQINPQFNVWAEARFDAGTDTDNNNVYKDFDAVAGTTYAENVFSIGTRYTF